MKTGEASPGSPHPCSERTAQVPLLPLHSLGSDSDIAGMGERGGWTLPWFYSAERNDDLGMARRGMKRQREEGWDEIQWWLNPCLQLTSPRFLPLDVIPLSVQAKLARSATFKRYVLYLGFCVGIVAPRRYYCGSFSLAAAPARARYCTKRKRDWRSAVVNCPAS